MAADDLIEALVDALERCRRHLNTLERAEHSPAAWGVLEADEEGRLRVGDVLGLVGEPNPVWEGAPGTHPLLGFVESALRRAGRLQ